METVVVIFIVACLIISLSIAHWRNQKMDKANDDYKLKAELASDAIRQANASLKRLSEIVYARDAESRINEVKDKKNEYLSRRKEAFDTIKRAERSRQNAYDAERSGVRTQNIFLGGARNWSAFSLYTREDELRSIGINVQFDDPTEILDRANQLINYQRMKQEIFREPELKEDKTV